MEQLVIVLIVGAVALVKWLMKAGENKEPDQTSPTPSAFGPARRDDGETERMRRFMEALGMPPGSAPPARKAPRPAPTRDIVEQQRQPRTRKTARQGEPLSSPRAPVVAPARPEEPVFMPVAEESPSFAVQPMPVSEPAEVSARRTDVRLLLRANGGLRDAVMVSEILGLPRGLQSRVR